MPVSGTIYPTDRHFKNFFPIFIQLIIFFVQNSFPSLCIIQPPPPPKKKPRSINSELLLYQKYPFGHHIPKMVSLADSEKES